MEPRPLRNAALEEALEQRERLLAQVRYSEKSGDLETALALEYHLARCEGAIAFTLLTSGRTAQGILS
jgi:hypothetical protein